MFQTHLMAGQRIRVTGGSFYELREWSDGDWQDARERIEAQNLKDKAPR